MIPYKYRPEIDGLRALAVMLVLLFHAGLGFSGGYVGVDVFFVISGFLITQMILKEQREGTFRFKTFWLRRVRRILPASLAMVVVVLIAGAVLLLPRDYEQLAEATVAQQLLFANIHFWKNTGYFDGPSEMMPLLHTWSLAVEEQFYLVYPCVLAGIGRLCRKRQIATLLCVFAASLVWSIVEVQQDPSAAFYLLPTRAWEMLLGGILCFAPPPTSIPSKFRELLSWSGLLAIVGAGWCFDSLTPFPGAAALLPCLGTAALIYVNSVDLTRSGRWLALRPIVFVGLISYSLYLWHWPIFAFTRYWIGEDLGAMVGVLLLAVSFVMAIISWKFIETPFRGRRPIKSAAKTQPGLGLRPFVPALAATVVVLGISVLIQDRDGFRQRFSADVLSILERSKLPVEYYTKIEESVEDLPALGQANRNDQEIDFLVWGDSHAMAIGRLVDRLAEKHNLTGTIAAAPGTLPLLGVWRAGASAKQFEIRAWNEAVLHYVRQNRIRNVILVGRWAVHVEGRPNGDLDTLVVDRHSARPSFPESRKVLQRGIERTLTSLEEAGARVWILGQIPLQEQEPTKRLVRFKLFGRADGSQPKGIALEDHLDRQSSVMAIMGQLRTRHVFLDPAEAFFDSSGHSILGDGKQCFYCDNDHISPDGAESLLSPLFDPVMADISASRLSARTETFSSDSHAR